MPYWKVGDLLGLIVHLPLTGDLHNQGLSNYESFTVGTATYVNTGKIGKCLNLGTGYVNTGYGGGTHEEFTITMWVKMNSSTQNQMIIGGNISNFRLYVGIKSGTYNLAFGSNTWGRTTNATVDTSKWQFIAVTVKDKVCSLYCDGKFVESFTTTSAVTFAQSFCIGDNTYLPNMQVNDYRVYDECLDELRLKLISQALILHYPMGNVDGVIGGRNLFLRTDVETSNNEYLFKMYTPVTPLVAGEVYTVSICVTPATGVSRFGLYFSGGYQSARTLYTDGTNSKQIISGTFTASYYSGKTPTDSIIYARAELYRYPNNGTVTENSTVHWFKIEKGTQATPYTPAPEDYPSQYENIIYDTSGYQHNGTVTDASRPTWNNESPRYKGSYEFDGTDDRISFNLSPNEGYKNSWTISFWTRTDSTLKIPFAFNNNLYMVFGSKGNISWNEPNGYDNQFSNATYAPSESFVHYAVVTTDSENILYINGEHIGTTTVYKTLNNATRGVISGWLVDNSYFWNGCISDFRIYATALSPDEIMDLYKTSAYIDSSGNLISYGLEENDE